MRRTAGHGQYPQGDRKRHGHGHFGEVLLIMKTVLQSTRPWSGPAVGDQKHLQQLDAFCDVTGSDVHFTQNY